MTRMTRPAPALAWRLARRDLRGGLGRFRILLACLVVGVAAIAAVGSVEQSIVAGLRADARQLLGGDVDVSRIHEPLAERERRLINDRADETADVVEMRAMARAVNGDGIRALVELKAVDDAYPLVGHVQLRPDGPLDEALGYRNGAWGAVLERGVLDRLGIAVGDAIQVGESSFVVRAVIEREPDRVATVAGFGPRLMIAAGALPETGLIQPGSLVRFHTRAVLPPGTDVTRWAGELAAVMPDSGVRIRDVSGAAPGVERFVERMSLFLTFVGLSALLVGGLGISNGVRAHLDSRTATIATLKCLGAPTRLVFRMYLLQVLLLAAIGIAMGLVLGALLPVIGLSVLEGVLPLRAQAGVYPGPLGLAALFGLLTAVTFALWPLARARQVPAANLFRSAVAPVTARPRLRDALAVAGAALALAALTVGTAAEPRFALAFVAGAAASLLLLRASAALVTAAAKRLPALGASSWRLAVANLHRPSAPTASVVVSLGIGVAALVAIGLIEGSLRAQIRDRLPDSAPAWFFIDIQDAQAQAFDETVLAVDGVERVERVPSLRGRITRIDGVPAAEADVAPESAWALRGDRGLTTAAEPPANVELVAGSWWSPDYDGPPLVSFDAGIAEGFGVGIGDTLTVNVLGRNLEVTIASLRAIDWQSVPFDFVLILSPGALAGAPMTHIAAVFATPESELALDRAVAAAFPNVTGVRVREALEAVNGLVSAIGSGVRAAGAVTLAAGLLVLLGAMAADRQRRTYDAVVFKVLGATRLRIARLYFAEYGLLGLVTGLIAALIGGAAAWAVTVLVMGSPWVFLPGTAAGIVGVAVAATVIAGFAGTWQVLGRKAAPLLRND
ncbi:MAG: FtsX-like permease family protein [Rhodospirillales bacterium]|nr:MAG: FtsX-like permease family protein [Rhodospirillales bacterium]